MVGRRQFLTHAVVAGAASVVAPRLSAAGTASRSLTFDNLHTGEKLAVEYVNAGAYVPDALQAVNHLLRDFRTGDLHAIDPALLDVLFDVHRLTGSKRPFEVISGYRSPATNAMLHRRSEGVASGSLHMQGKAIDIRLADVTLRQLRRCGLARRAGGVGYYPASNFVHLDTGRVRFW